MREIQAILQGMVDEHLSTGDDKGSVDKNSMIDHLLYLKKKNRRERAHHAQTGATESHRQSIYEIIKVGSLGLENNI